MQTASNQTNWRTTWRPMSISGRPTDMMMMMINNDEGILYTISIWHVSYKCLISKQIQIKSLGSYLLFTKIIIRT